jgi:hypothetical protein
LVSDIHTSIPTFSGRSSSPCAAAIIVAARTCLMHRRTDGSGAEAEADEGSDEGPALAGGAGAGAGAGAVADDEEESAAPIAVAASSDAFSEPNEARTPSM